jgi:hypothetical protein
MKSCNANRTDDYSLCLDEQPRCRSALLTAPIGCNQLAAGLVSVSLVTDYVKCETSGK